MYTFVIKVPTVNKYSCIYTIYIEQLIPVYACFVQCTHHGIYIVASKTTAIKYNPLYDN